MTNEPTSQANSDKVRVDAICIHCNKRFTSMRSALNEQEEGIAYENPVTIEILIVS